MCEAMDNMNEKACDAILCPECDSEQYTEIAFEQGNRVHGDIYHLRCDVCYSLFEVEE